MVMAVEDPQAFEPDLPNGLNVSGGLKIAILSLISGRSRMFEILFNS